MKILMLLDKVFPPDTRVENEIESLHQAGHEVFLLCYGEPDGYTYRANIPNWFHKKFSALALLVPFYFWAWKHCVSEKIHEFSLQGHQMEAIHIHDLRLAKIGEWAARKFNLIYILDLHENYPAALQQYKFSNTWLGKFLISQEAWRRYEIEQIRAAYRVIVVIEEMAERIKALGAKQVFIVPNYVNLNRFKPERELMALYFGGMDRHRGLETLVDAVEANWQRRNN